MDMAAVPSAAPVRLPQTPGRGVPKVWLAAGAVLVVAVIIALSLIGDDGANPAVPPSESNGLDEPEQVAVVDAGQSPADAAITPVKQPVEPPTPIRVQDMQRVLDRWRQAKLNVRGFDSDLADKKANGSCAHGIVGGVSAYLCLAKDDPIRRTGIIRRPIQEGDSPTKWRPRIRRGALHLRVEEVPKRKKKIRRKIESVFKSVK